MAPAGRSRLRGRGVVHHEMFRRESGWRASIDSFGVLRQHDAAAPAQRVARRPIGRRLALPPAWRTLQPRRLLARRQQDRARVRIVFGLRDADPRRSSSGTPLVETMTISLGPA